MRNRALPVVLATLMVVAVAAPAQAVIPKWAPAGEASIRPGNSVTTGGNQCTSNFVFYNRSGEVFLGQAAHCSSSGAASDTNGCTTPAGKIGSPVVVEGASKPGVLAYNSWITMQAVKEKDPNACAYNDFALVRLQRDDWAKVNPSIPKFGGPTGIATSTKKGDRVLNFANSPLRGNIADLKPQVGISRGQEAGGWLHTAYTILPGVPGDSGSAFLDNQGRAFGVLSTLNLFPEPLSNGIADLSKSLDYANRKGNILPVELANGTEPFVAGATDDPIRGLDPVLTLVEDLLKGLGLG